MMPEERARIIHKAKNQVLWALVLCVFGYALIQYNQTSAGLFICAFGAGFAFMRLIVVAWRILES